MDATARAFAKRVWREVAQHYQNPENERRYQQWKQERDATAAKQVRVPCPTGQAKA